MIAKLCCRGFRVPSIRTSFIGLGFLVLMGSSAHASLMVSTHTGTVLKYNGSTGAFVELNVPTGAGPFSTISGLALGQDGSLYVGCQDLGYVLRYSLGGSNGQGGNGQGGNSNGGGSDGNGGQHGNKGDIFAAGGGLSPSGLLAGPDGNVYVSNPSTNEVRRFDGHTGYYLGPFAFGGGLVSPAGLTFGPDSNLYVASNQTGSVVRFSGLTGLPMDAFVPAGSGGLDHPVGLTFGPDGSLYVASRNTNSVIRYNGTTGAPMGTFAAGGGLTAPTGLAFGPDRNLYVSSSGTDSILRFNGTTGAFLNTFVPAGSGGLTAPQLGLLFLPLEAPEGLSANVLTASQVSLSWTDTNDDETGHSIWRSTNGNNWSQIGSVGANVTTYTDSGLSPNTLYQYQVEAFNSLGTSFGGQTAQVFIPVPPPATPSGLGGSAVSNTQVNLSWTDNSNNETAFVIWRRTGSGAWARAAVLPPNTTAYSDTGLSPNTTYSYRVRATTNGAASAWSNEFTATTPA